jgi:uncharacterized protein YdhG (YjbR/CyaY superfamily)
MEGDRGRPATVDEYIAQFPENTQAILTRIRTVIREAAPEAEERIGYGMPGYYLNGPLAYFAAHAHHIGFYPTPAGTTEFEGQLSAYKRAKGSVQFPLDKPIPYDLIGRIVRFRAAQNAGKPCR